MIWHFGIHYAVYTASVVFSPTPPPVPVPVPVVQVVKAPTTTTVPPAVQVAPTTTTTTLPTTTTTTALPTTTTTTQPKSWYRVGWLSGTSSKLSRDYFGLQGGELRLTWTCASSCWYALIDRSSSTKQDPSGDDYKRLPTSSGVISLEPRLGTHSLGADTNDQFTFTLEELR